MCSAKGTTVTGVTRDKPVNLYQSLQPAGGEHARAGRRMFFTTALALGAGLGVAAATLDRGTAPASSTGAMDGRTKLTYRETAHIRHAYARMRF
jgi:hypothetical protein